jgi:hypothetical protein
MAEDRAARAKFTPDVVQKITDEKLAEDAAGGRSGALKPHEIGKEATAVRLRLLTVQVMRGLNHILPFGSGGVYLVSSVADGLGSDPIHFEGKTYRGIKDGDLLPLGPANEPNDVFNVYLREGQLPRTLSFCLLVVRSNQDLRETATAITAVLADSRYKTLADSITAAVSAAAPAYGIVAQAAQAAIGLIAEYLKVKPDDQLGYYQANYTNRFDNLGVGRHPAERVTFDVGDIRLAYQIEAS